MLCSCEFTFNNIIDDAFSCQGSQGQLRNTVVYRAMITLQVPAAITDADNIVTNINQWVQTEPRVRVDGVILDVDPDCPTMLDSFNSDDCVIEVPSNPTSSSSSSPSSLVGIIIGVVVAAVVVVIVVIILVIIIAMYRRRKSTYRYYIMFNIAACKAHKYHTLYKTSYL